MVAGSTTSVRWICAEAKLRRRCSSKEAATSADELAIAVAEAESIEAAIDPF